MYYKKNFKLIGIMLMIVVLIIIFFSNKRADKKNIEDINNSNDTINSNDVAFNEFSFNLENKEDVKIKYMLYNNSKKIYSISPVSNNNKYDISYNKSSLVYLSNDNCLWLFKNDGTSKKLIQQELGEIQNPKFVALNKIMFYSNEQNKSIWIIDTEDTNLKKVYTPLDSNFRYLGDRADNKIIIIDKDNMILIDIENYNIESKYIGDKYIMNISPDGKNIIFCEKNNDNINYKNLYLMTSFFDNIDNIPRIDGFTPTEIGAWNEVGKSYAYIIKSDSLKYDKLALMAFDDENNIMVTSIDISNDFKFDNKYKLSWSGNNIVSIDTGESSISIDVP